MKKIFTGIFLFMALAMFCAPAQAATANTAQEPAKTQNPALQFTGKYWVQSTESNKEAYLYGIESAIAVEYEISAKLAADAAKARKKSALVLSPFERGWMEAFRHSSRKEIMQGIDKWYADNPDQLDRPVIGVIWHELVAPRLAAAKK